MERILITGGAGYIGSVLTGFLLRHKHKVTVLDNLCFQQSSLFHCASDANFDFVRGDVRDERLMQEIIPKHDVILPLAALVGMPICEKDKPGARSVNLDAIIMLNRLRSRQQKVILPCTNSGYGTKSGQVSCDEETPLEPVSLYGETKVKAEEELLGSPNAISLRLATVFGPSPRMRTDLLVNDFVLRALTDRYLVIFEKEFRRNYVHIEDVAECFLFCLNNFDSMKGQAYNVGLNDASLSKAELALKIKEQMPELYIHYAEVGYDPDKRNYVVSNAKINQKGFYAKRSLEEGIGQLIKLYRMLPRADFKNV